MLISIRELSRIWGIKPIGVLHVGAHLAEESFAYTKCKFGPVTWVEAQPDLAEVLIARLDAASNTVIQAAVWDQDGIEMEFNVASNGESSSLLEFGTHSLSYPGIKFESVIKMRTKRLYNLLPVSFVGDFLNLDIQGAELQALKGLGDKLSHFKWVYTEVNRKEVYKGCAQVTQIDEFLANYKFERVATRWVLGHGWGDALYVSKELELQNFNRSLWRFSELKWRLISIKWFLSGILRKIELLLPPRGARKDS